MTKMNDFNGSKAKNIPRVKEVIIPPAPTTEEEIKAQELKKKKIQNLVVQMMVDYIKKNYNY